MFLFILPLLKKKKVCKNVCRIKKIIKCVPPKYNISLYIMVFLQLFIII